MKKIQGARTAITIIRQKDNSTLVQYVDEGVLTRKFVPTAEVKDGFVSDQVLSMGIPYGYPWNEIVLTFDSHKFENELHNVDVWTVEDALKFPQRLSSALHATLAANLSKILEVSKYEKGVIKNG